MVMSLKEVSQESETSEAQVRWTTRCTCALLLAVDSLAGLDSASDEGDLGRLSGGMRFAGGVHLCEETCIDIGAGGEGDRFFHEFTRHGRGGTSRVSRVARLEHSGRPHSAARI